MHYRPVWWKQFFPLRFPPHNDSSLCQMDPNEPAQYSVRKTMFMCRIEGKGLGLYFKLLSIDSNLHLIKCFYQISSHTALFVNR